VCAEGWVCRAGECTDPASGCDFSNLGFPVWLSGDVAVGDVTIDPACNLYLGVEAQNGNSSGVVYKISAATGTASVLAELPEVVRGLVYRPEDGMLYGTYPDQLISLATDGLGLTVFTESATTQHLNGMTLAPANWGERGGYLVIAKTTGTTGEIIAYDPEYPLPELVAVMDTEISDVEFDGPELYAAAYGLKQIQHITPEGVVSTFVDLPCGPDGLTVEPGVRLFATCGEIGELYAIDVDTREIDLLGQVSLNMGWAPSGLLWDNGALFVFEQPSGLNVLFP